MNRRIASFCLLLCCVSTSASALEIRIRAEAKLDVSASAAGTVAQVAGALRDDLGRGLPQRDLLVQIEARKTGVTVVSHHISTDARGRFGVQEELPPGRYEVFVRFDKTEHLDGIADSQTIELQAAPVDVRAYGPAFVYERKNPAWLSARANSGTVPYQGWAEVDVNSRSVGRMEFDASGRGTFDVAPHLVPGANELLVRTPGSAYRDEAEATVPMRFAESVVVEAGLDEGLQGLRRGLAVSGTIRDENGPIGDLRVVGHIESLELFEEGEEPRSFAVSTTTDSRGRYSAFVPDNKLSDGVWSGRAEFVPPRGERVGADAGTTEIDTRAYRWAVNGFGVFAIFLGLLALMVRLGRSLFDRFLAWRRHQEQKAREAAALEEVETIVPIFLDADPDTSMEISADDVGGVAWDVWQSKPLAGARVELRPEVGSEVWLVETDAHGRFRFTEVSEGPWQLDVQLHGFIRGQLPVRLPHDGGLSNFRLDMVAVPLKIRRLYGSILEQSVGEDLWGRLSPQQIEARLEQIWPGDDEATRADVRAAVASRLRGESDLGGLSALRVLTGLVEESYFSNRRHGEEAFLFARALVLELKAQTNSEGAE